MTPEILFPGVYIEEVPSGIRAIRGVPTSVTAFLGRMPQASPATLVRLASIAELRGVFAGSPGDSPLGRVLETFFANGGDRALVAPISDGTPAAIETGLAALAGERWNLLCLPPEPDAATTGGGLAGLGAAGVAALASFCEARRAFLILDADPDWTDQASALAGRAALGSAGRSAALYFPWLRLPGDAAEVPPSGAVAGLYARTDASRGVWKAPAGVDATLHGVTGLSVDLSDGEGGELNAAAVNCLRRFPGAGPVVWGSRTLSSDPEWKYVPVRRLFIFLEESIDRGTQWAVFEPNAQSLWDQLRHAVEEFLHTLWREGAFQGAKRQEAFFVRCGRETTSTTEIAAGIVHLEVGFAPLRPAEFVVLRRAIRTATPAKPAPAGRRSLARLAAAASELPAASFRGRPGGPALLALFSGPAGAGKTLAARSLARRLRRPLYRVDLASEALKYIGETEKNLARLFDRAEARGAVIFFDEADALFGERTATSDAHDRYANIEVSHLLERLRRFGGLVILATRRPRAIAAAFRQRCRFRVEFNGEASPTAARDRPDS